MAPPARGPRDERDHLGVWVNPTRAPLKVGLQRSHVSNDRTTSHRTSAQVSQGALIFDSLLDLARELGAEVFLEEMQPKIDGGCDTTRGGHHAVFYHASLDDVRDRAEFVPRALVGRRLPSREESRGTQDQRARAHTGNRLLRSEVEEPLQELRILNDFLAPGSSRDDDKIEVGKLVVDLVSEEFHPECTGDLLLHRTKADCEVEFRMDLLRLREDLIHPDRVELLDAVEDQNADPHGSGVSVSWLNRSAPNGGLVVSDSSS